MSRTPWNKGKKGLQIAWNKGKPWSRKAKEKMSKAKKNKHGESHNAWKGDDAGYFALHLRVNNQRGRPKFCEVCKTFDERKRYEWANLTGNYTNIKDYKRMCQSCHRRHDNKIKEEDDKRKKV